MTKILQWIHSRPTLIWAAVALYTLAVSYPHVMVQDWLVGWIGANGFPAFYAGMAILAVTIAAAISWLYFRALSSHAARQDLLRAWALTLIFVLLAWRFLSVNNSELIHFGQYAFPGIILFALTRSVTESMAWITIMAGIDEGYQFWGLHSDWGIPWDFNDIVMDLLGGTLGILFALGFLPVTAKITPPRWRRPGTLLLISLYLAAIILWAAGLMLIFEDKSNTRYWFSLSRLTPTGFWFYDVTWGPRTIHALTPIEGPVLIALFIAMYSRFDARYEVRTH